MNNSKAISLLFGFIVGVISTLTALFLGITEEIKLLTAAIISFSTSTLLFAIITENLFDKKINMWLNSTYYESTGSDVAEKELSSLGYLFKDYGRHPDMEISSEGSKVAISKTHFISPKKYEDPWEEQIMNDFINQDNILNY